jgi:hypothetical protein
MVAERFYDLNADTGQTYFDGLRCIGCGEILDPIILTNRMEAESLLTH